MPAFDINSALWAALYLLPGAMRLAIDGTLSPVKFAQRLSRDSTSQVDEMAQIIPRIRTVIAVLTWLIAIPFWLAVLFFWPLVLIVDIYDILKDLPAWRHRFTCHQLRKCTCQGQDD